MIANAVEKYGFEVKFAHDGNSALQLCLSMEFYFVLTDNRIGKMDGLTLAKNLSKIYPNLPFIIVTEYPNDIFSSPKRPFNIKDVISKPFNQTKLETVLSKIAHYYQSDGTNIELTGQIDVILIGASTGGPQILSKILKDLPKHFPPIVIIQHLPFRYQKSFGQRLEQVSGLQLKLVSESTRLMPGCIYFPDKDDSHLSVFESSGKLFVKPDSSSAIHGHRPAVDPLFLSAARNLHTTKVLAILLTGMGIDGASGLESLLRRKHITIAQNKKSSIVFGMPRAAIERHAAQYILDDREIRESILNLKKVSHPKKAAS